MNNDISYRHEYKYLIDELSSVILRTRLDGLLARDFHANNDGTYRISSLYFDDYNNSCYYENEAGVDDRSKYRIRIYNGSADRITLEKKSKKHGMTHKESCSISEECCNKIMNGEYSTINELSGDSNLLLLEMKNRVLRPAVIVEYIRYPYVCVNGNVRVTLDEKISSSKQIERFLKDDYIRRPIMPMGQSILEVKWDKYLPDYIKNQLELDNLAWSSFSKYYYCRKVEDML